MVLHKLASKPHVLQALANCLSVCKETDGILLTEDSVYAAINDIQFNSMLAITDKLYLLESDAKARGLHTLPDKVQVIDYPQMVDLTLQYDKTISW